jgi:hypothetical protein
LQIREEERVAAYLPGLAGAETGAGLELSSTEPEPLPARTMSTVRVIEVSIKTIAE